MRVFSFLNAKTKTEGGESYLQFGASIKMQIVGNHFSALTTEALSLQRPKTPRRMDPLETTTQNSLSLNRSTDEKGAEDFFLSFLLQVLLFCKGDVFSYSVAAAQEQMLDWPHGGCVTVDVRSGSRSVNQSEGTRRPWGKNLEGTGVLKKKRRKGWNILLMKEATFLTRKDLLVKLVLAVCKSWFAKRLFWILIARL